MYSAIKKKQNGYCSGNNTDYSYHWKKEMNPKRTRERHLLLPEAEFNRLSFILPAISIA